MTIQEASDSARTVNCADDMSKAELVELIAQYDHLIKLEPDTASALLLKEHRQILRKALERKSPLCGGLIQWNLVNQLLLF